MPGRSKFSKDVFCLDAISKTPTEFFLHGEKELQKPETKDKTKETHKLMGKIGWSSIQRLKFVRRRSGHNFELCHPHAQRGCFIHMFNICILVGSKGLTFGAGRACCGVWHLFFRYLWHHTALSIAGQGHTVAVRSHRVEREGWQELYSQQGGCCRTAPLEQEEVGPSWCWLLSFP